MDASLSRVGAEAGVQIADVAPATLHVAFVAVSSPLLVHVAVPVPVPVTEKAACMSARAWEAIGVTAAEGTEAGPVPAELIAATVNVYAMPFVNPSNE
jgi:hypothetical protein